MSFKSMELFWKLPHSSLTPHEQLLYVHLAKFADKNGDNIFPSIPYLMSATGLSKSTVIRSVKSLIRKKIIIKQKNSGRKSNLYKIDFEAIKKLIHNRIDKIEEIKKSVDKLACSGVSQTPLDEKPVSHRHLCGVSQTPYHNHISPNDCYNSSIPSSKVVESGLSGNEFNKNELVLMFIELGFHDNEIKRCLRDYSIEQIVYQLRCFAEIQRDGKKIQNPGAYLRAMLIQAYGCPTQPQTIQ